MSRHAYSVCAEALESRYLLAGVELVKDIVAGPDPSIALTFAPDEHAIARGKFFFEAADENGSQLWVSDGTADGTKPLIPPGVETSASVGDVIAGDDGNVYFSGQSKFGNQIFRTGGTKATTIGLANFTFGTGAEPIGFVNGQLIFFTDNTNSPHLWRVDGSAPEILGLGISGAGAIATVGNKFFLSTQSSAPNFPKGLYVTDGKTLTFLHSGTADTGAQPRGANLNGLAIFSASDGAPSYEIWKSDGTPGGTKRVTNTFPDSGLPQSNLTAAGNKVYFTFEGQLYSTDGSTSTKITNYSNVNTEQGIVRDLTDVNGTLFFTHGDTNRNLYKLVNGKPVLVGTEAGGTQGGIKPAFLTAVGTTLYFSALDKAGKARLFQSDGKSIARVGGTAVTNPVPLRSVKGNLYLQADTEATGTELFVVKADAEPPPVEPYSLTLSAKNAAGDPKHTINEGELLHFTCTLTGDTATKLEWFWQDGTGTVGGFVHDHTFANNLPDNATRLVRLKITTANHGIKNLYSEVTVQNVAPTISLTVPPAYVTWAPMPFVGRVIDPGVQDKLTVDVDWEDGTKETYIVGKGGFFSGAHIYSTMNLLGYDIKATVRDGDGGKDEAKENVNVGRVLDPDPKKAAYQVLGVTNILLGGTSKDDKISVVRAAKQPDDGGEALEFYINGLAVGVLEVIRREKEAKEVQVYSGAGNDRVIVGPNVTTQFKIDAGSGRDTIKGGVSQDLLIGGAGVDTFLGSSADKVRQ